MEINITKVKNSWGTKTSHNPSSVTSDNWGTKSNLNIKPNLTFNSHLQLQKPKAKYPVGDNTPNEFLCFIRPSELQQFLFQQFLNHYTSIKQNLSLEILHSLDFRNVILQICNHPSFVNHKTTKKELIRHLIPSLPDWSDI